MSLFEILGCFAVLIGFYFLTELAVKMRQKKYWHELPDEEIQKLLDKKKTWGYVMKRYKQPGWCDYPEALGGATGCWSLVDCFGRRKEIGKTMCKTCDCSKYYRKK